MKRFFYLILFCTICFFGNAQKTNRNEAFAHTFSIVARDPHTGDLAVGVQSHWFSVGTTVSWAEAGVGAIATQSFVNKSFGIRGLKLLKAGKTAQEALDILLGDDPGKEVRQVAIVDVAGNVAVYTGKNCVDYAGHVKGSQFSVQSNMMLTDKVPNAMAKAFEANASLPLPERVLKAMEAAQLAGGDIRGKQSAAILVVNATDTGKPWDDNHKTDLRVDDHALPFVELARLLKIQRAYEHMNEGDLAVENNNMTKAMDEYGAAMKMFPDNLEMQYWTAIALANSHEIAKSVKLLKKIYSKDSNWLEMTKRLPKVGLLNVSESEFKLLLAR